MRGGNEAGVGGGLLLAAVSLSLQGQGWGKPLSSPKSLLLLQMLVWDHREGHGAGGGGRQRRGWTWGGVGEVGRGEMNEMQLDRMR